MGNTFSTPKDTNCWALVDIESGSIYIGTDNNGNYIPVMFFQQASIGFRSDMELVLEKLDPKIQKLFTLRKIKLI